MLIRSQDRETLINLDNSIVIDVMDIEGTIKVVCSYSCEDYVIGHYSTRGKALKVLDMIQEAYADAELIPMTVPNIGKMFAEGSASKENELLAEAIGEVLMKKMVFQMPADNEVEV